MSRSRLSLLAAATAAGVALLAAPATAAPPTPGDPTPVEFLHDGCSFPTSVALDGKGKFIELPDGRGKVIAAGTKATVTNLDTGERYTTTRTGTVHITPDGVRLTGRFLALTPDGWMVLIGSFTIDQETGEPVGSGRQVDVCDVLAP